MNDILSKSQISDYYREVLQMPSFVNQLNDYQKDVVTEYADEILMRAYDFADKSLLLNPNQQYSANYEGRELQYWLDIQGNYRDATKVKQAIAGQAKKKDLTDPAPVATSTNANQGKNKGDSGKDPYNANVKAKFLDMVIEDGIIKVEIYRNNDEKFASYANILRDEFGLVVSAGTLENNWNKGLKKKEVYQLRKLLITQQMKHLAVKLATMGR
jgi:hypothetical protein